MDFYSLFLIAIALSLDAFGVALCIGLNNNVDLKYKSSCAIYFGFFQFLFAIIGGYAGFLFNKYIATMPQIVGGVVICIVGIIMIKEGIENEDSCKILKPGMNIILGISVSIDAMVVGFTALNKIQSGLLILRDTLFIGIVTLFVSILAFITSKYLKKIDVIGKYADYIGGIILIFFGLKMIFF
ncbi:manganese efflux pump MntP [Clostridium tetani]|uniref:Manganese exporter MntP n=2 Tax=Clostridium tetani TaxID=1513 RepID=MNTP_CLOTE|nr:manganese efflux pump MntP family protein [Clostridium tetani]Q898D6.2 RecName: Full=Putative manganese efflux pump MntP [Clostridium tetani E88]KGI36396.1 membrane protein [Clostridium tetani]KGI37521.1 membrane protein [Clostridium tetani ATCC 9441]KGI42039.1 membrane protein [Clostridium tetani]KGI46118.1 membrane protein [Clostridium tetani]KHO37970.1 membrane protein [Clostridium tetani]